VATGERPWIGLAANLRVTLAACVMRRAAPGRLVASPAQLVALVALNLAVELAFAVASAGIPGEFDPGALPRALFHALLALLAGSYFAWREREPAQLLRLAILFAGVRLWYGLLFGALDALVDAGLLGEDGAYDSLAEQLWYAVYALWIAAMVRGAAGLGRVPGWRTRLHALAAAAIVAVPLWLVPGAALWHAEQADDDPGQDWFAASREEVIYAQPALLDAALWRLAPQRPGVPDLYFVGVAGFAGEDVFMKEVGVLEDLFRRRFDTEGRAITLVNNAQTVARRPVASATALARVLEHIGRVMDREEDVLFLYLTSHGSEDHRLTMEFWPLKLNDLDPQSLRRALDQAGIKWRVVAISACYSGGFIDALRDEHTLVVTAADAARQSFGCGAESDLTYFGRAYDAALRDTFSFTEAFERARRHIAAREQSEALPPSNPQLFVGAQMPQKLEALRAHLSRHANVQARAAPAASAPRGAASCSTC
jgi:hypothetical protein